MDEARWELLEARLRELETRLARLEASPEPGFPNVASAQPAAAIGSPPAPPVLTSSAPPPPPGRGQAPLAQQPARRLSTAGAAQPAPAAERVAAAAPVPPTWGQASGTPSAPRAMPSLRELEERFAGRALAWAGGLALVAAAIFFMSLAFSRGWINEPLRVLIGLFAGCAALVGGGVFLDRRNRPMGNVLAAVGLGVISVSLFAATRLYGLIPPELGLLAALVTVIAAAALAIHFDAREVAAFGLVAALVAPLLVGAPPTALTLAFLAVTLIGTTRDRDLPVLALAAGDRLRAHGAAAGGLVGLGPECLRGPRRAGRVLAGDGHRRRGRGVQDPARRSAAIVRGARGRERCIPRVGRVRGPDRGPRDVARRIPRHRCSRAPGARRVVPPAPGTRPPLWQPRRGDRCGAGRPRGVRPARRGRRPRRLVGGGRRADLARHPSPTSVVRRRSTDPRWPCGAAPGGRGVSARHGRHVRVPLGHRPVGPVCGLDACCGAPRGRHGRGARAIRADSLGACRHGDPPRRLCNPLRARRHDHGRRLGVAAARGRRDRRRATTADRGPGACPVDEGPAADPAGHRRGRDRVVGGGRVRARRPAVARRAGEPFRFRPSRSATIRRWSQRCS